MFDILRNTRQDLLSASSKQRTRVDAVVPYRGRRGFVYRSRASKTGIGEDTSSSKGLHFSQRSRNTEMEGFLEPDESVCALGKGEGACVRGSSELCHKSEIVNRFAWLEQRT